MIRIVAGVALLALALQTPWEDAARVAAEGDLVAAEAAYRALLAQSPEDPAILYNLGTVLARQGRFDDARLHLEAAAQAGVPAGAAPYNLGNTDLEPAFADSVLAERDERLLRSIESYKSALRVDPDDADARWNLELARRLLERENPPPDGGGGGGGGGGEGPPQQGERQPAPTAGGGPGPEPRMTETEAEELLRSAQEREMDVQRDRLKKPQPPGPIRP